MPPLVFWQTMVSTEGSVASSPMLVTLAWPMVPRLLASGTRSAPANAVPPLIASTNAPVNKRVLNVDMTTSLAVLSVGRGEERGRSGFGVTARTDALGR